MRFLVTFYGLVLATSVHADWFNDLKTAGSSTDIYRVLYYMPKGGDLHNHLSGSSYSEWWYELALAQKERGYEYYTKVRIENCVDYGSDAFSYMPYYLMFRNISAAQYAELSDCEKREHKRLEDLNDEELAGWLDSIRLDKPHEGRDEFFQTHWQRLFALTMNPWLQAETLVRNMQAFSEEGLIYLETQVAVEGMRNADGTEVTPAQTVDILRERLQAADARSTGITVRFQLPLLRFLPNAEYAMRANYAFVVENRDYFVGIDLVGREDNDKGHPRRFLETLRELRRQHGGVGLAIHAGEVDEPNSHVRDTLLLGADRIGHGLNLITDDDTMLLMRHGPYLVEVNLISNYLLNYVSDYSQHPFPEYLRIGIPVALSTDDRGMWESNMTDEFFVAVAEFNLSWDEIKLLSRNSLRYAFLPEASRTDLLQEFDERMRRFERNMQRRGVAGLGPMPATRQFVCNRYSVCSGDDGSAAGR